MRALATVRVVSTFALLVSVGSAAGGGGAHQTLPTAAPNANGAAAGALRGGVLAVTLEARLAMWHPDGDSLPGIPIEAFGEPGRAPQVPGPLIRVPRGTDVRATVRNALGRDTLTFFFPSLTERAARPSTEPAPLDSLVIPPGGVRTVRLRAGRAGTYLYRATTSTPLARKLRVGGLLAGAVVVDSPARVGGPPRDRIFVITGASDSAEAVFGLPIMSRTVFAVNGRAWPHTERVAATVGDTARWHVLNATNDVHPMHLHGFYFRVDANDSADVAGSAQSAPGRMAVTERVAPFATMLMTWTPERAGNWLFHCHHPLHLVPHGALGEPGPSGAPRRIAPAFDVAGEQPHAAHGPHALTGMAGIVLGVNVQPRRGQRFATPASPQRQLRLVAVRDTGFPSTAPSMRYLLDGTVTGTSPLEGRGGVSPPLYLTRGEPVSITVVNRLPEPTAVHWHGIELESYYDGVAGFGGLGKRISPIIAPLDSFEARFTPPRAGTFIYHSHVDEPRQHRAGLVGALIVVDPARPDTSDDRIFVLKSARQFPTGPTTLEVNGSSRPDTVRLRVGQRYRLRFLDVTTVVTSASVTLTARPDSAFATRSETMLAEWRPLAKDGADLPAQARAPRAARQVMGMGETYDFEFTPGSAGTMHVEVRVAAPVGPLRLLVRVPVRVE